MKFILQFFGWLSLITGLVAALVSFGFLMQASGSNFFFGLGVMLAYILAGGASGSLFLGLAEVIGRLERLEGDVTTIKRISRESEKKPHVPGWDADRG